MMILKKDSNPAAKVRAGVTPFGGGDHHNRAVAPFFLIPRPARLRI
jgi:hypothetical protein